MSRRRFAKVRFVKMLTAIASFGLTAFRTFEERGTARLRVRFRGAKVPKPTTTTHTRANGTTTPPRHMATAVPPRISDGSDTSIPGAATGTLAGGGALDVEGDAVRDAIDKLQRALTPSVVLDRELDARRNDAAKVASGAAYKSPYHDAHHATIVAASALLGRALGEGGVGTGFVYGAETMVRDALLMIEGAARDALRRDEGELPRLFDIAEGMRKRRDDARAAARQLVLAFSRQNAGMGFRERQRLRDAVAQAKAQSTRETEQEKARLAKEHESMREELELMQRQLIAARDASNAQIVQLSKQVQHERNARGGDALEHQQTGEHVRAKLEMAEVKIADLANQLRNAQRERAIEKAQLEDQLSEALEVGQGARAHAVNARTVLRRQKGRALRERCFVVWKIKAAAYALLKKQTMEAAETVKAVKKGYEVQIAKTEKACLEKVESMRNKLRGRDPRDANKPALGDSTNQKKGGNKAPRADPWSFLDESTKLEREIAKREREEERRARETVAMAMAEDHISKIDEYYAKAAEAARQRNAGRDDPNPEIVMVAHNVSLASHPPPSPLSMPLTAAREPRQSKGFVHTYGGGDRGATPRSGASSARSKIEHTPPRTAGRVPAPTRVPVRRAESSSSSSSEETEEPWKPESPEPPPPPPPKLGEPAEELAFTESLYGLVPPPQVPLGRKTRDAGVAAPRTEEEVEPAPPPPQRKLEPLTAATAGMSGIGRGAGRGGGLAPLMARSGDEPAVAASVEPARDRAEPLRAETTEIRSDPIRSELPTATTFIPPPPPRAVPTFPRSPPRSPSRPIPPFPRSTRTSEGGSRPGTSGGRSEGSGFPSRQPTSGGSRPGTAGASRPGTAGTAGAAGVRSSVASLAASEAHTEYSEDFDDLPEDLDLP